MTPQTDGQPRRRARPDRAQIEIDASAEQVWALMSAAGLVELSNDEEVEPDPVLRPGGRRPTSWCTKKHGEFRLQMLEATTEPRYVAFRWINNVAPEGGTTVEFWIDERARRRHAAGGRERLHQPAARTARRSRTRSARTPTAGRSSSRRPAGSSPRAAPT